MIYHSDPKELIVEEFGSDKERGLTAEQVTAKLAEFGPNKLREKKKKTMFRRFLDQFKDVMILILIAAAVVSFVIACTEGEAHAFFEPLLIIAIVIINAILGVMQESKAEKALLKQELYATA